MSADAMQPARKDFLLAITVWEEFEEFWLFEVSGKEAIERLPHLRSVLRTPASLVTAR